MPHLQLRSPSLASLLSGWNDRGASSSGNGHNKADPNLSCPTLFRWCMLLGRWEKGDMERNYSSAIQLQMLFNDVLFLPEWRKCLGLGFLESWPGGGEGGGETKSPSNIFSPERIQKRFSEKIASPSSDCFAWGTERLSASWLHCLLCCHPQTSGGWGIIHDTWPN